MAEQVSGFGEIVEADVLSKREIMREIAPALFAISIPVTLMAAMAFRVGKAARHSEIQQGKLE